MGFGDFASLCTQNSIPLCALVGRGTIRLDTSSNSPGILARCYARSFEVANTIIFQGATDMMHILALGMTIIMILHVRSKFTAVGRKEITTFFYIYMFLTVVSLVLDAGVIAPSSTSIYPYFTAIQSGLTSALCTCLLINGFVGFQLYEDGTTLSVWLLRLASFGMFVISFAVSLLTFKGWAGLGPMNTIGLFVVLYLINGIQLFVYLVMQVILVVNTLQDRWPLGDIAFGVFFFVIGQVILYTLSQRICESVQHYLDGMFFATTCNLLAVMMVYKYWDSITKEDLEFSVGTKQNNWEVKEPFLSSSASYSNSTSGFALDQHRTPTSCFDATSTEYGGGGALAPGGSSLYQQQLGSVSQHRLSQAGPTGPSAFMPRDNYAQSRRSSHRDSYGHANTHAHAQTQAQGQRHSRKESHVDAHRDSHRERDARRDSRRDSYRERDG